MATSTFINLPPPPSDPVTPSDMGPGTPNSATTSLSALSTTAIKDGHTGHPHPHHHHHAHRHTSSTSSNASTTTLDAERADRISRLAGLERIATVRQSAPTNNSSSNNNQAQSNITPPGGMSGIAAAAGTAQHTASGAGPLHGATVPQVQGYFDQTGTPVVGKERSTVGSASATGSAGGRTTWASGSDVYEPDKMSVGTGPEAEGEAMDAASSADGSEEGKESLVGFGEGAGSTAEGPVSSVPARSGGKLGAHRMGGVGGGESPMQGVVSGGAGAGQAQAEREREKERAKMIDGVTYDRNVVDTTARSPLPASSGLGAASGEGVAPGSHQGTPAPRHAGLSGTETAERIVRERFENGNASTGAGAGGSSDVTMGEADGQSPGLGKFDFEK